MKRLIAVSASLKPLLLASQIFTKHDQIIGTGNSAIFSVMEKLKKVGGTNKVITILNDDRVLARLLPVQKELVNSVEFINIFLGKTTSRPSEHKKGRILNLYLSGGQEQISKLFSDPDKEFCLEKAAGYSEIATMVQYYLTRFFMDMSTSKELETALSFLKHLNLNSTSFKNDKSVPWAAIELFQEKESPFLSGSSRTMSHLKKRIIQIGSTDMRTLIVGETGTGKELVAFFLHDYSPRRGKPFVSINCAGLDETFLRAELFGFVKGAFTGAVSEKTGLVQQAEGGTLFLDEIGDMPPAIQADLLRFLQNQRYRMLGCNKEKKANIRVISAGQPDIADKIQNKTFRADLYYRLSEVTVRTPALREIPEDIHKLIEGLLYQRVAKGDPYAKEAFSYFVKHREKLSRHLWPGNFRELANLVKKRTLLNDDVVSELSTSEIQPDGNISNKGVPAEDSEEIIPLQKMTSIYLKRVRRFNPKMSLRELAKKLEISENTLKKYTKS